MGTITISNQRDSLRVSTENTRYLTDRDGRVIFLAGSNYWNALQDGGRTNPPPAFDFNAFVNFLSTRGLNYTKAHVWEQAWHQSAAASWYIQPTIYARTGPGNALDGDPKFDLTQFNSTYFNRLRARCVQYSQSGIYVIINIFSRFSIDNGNTMTGVWDGNPFNASNNINGINGDPTSQGNGYDTETLIIPAVTAYQKTYVEHLIDTLNDLDNVIFEVAMEPWGSYSRGGYTPLDWVAYFIDYIHTYEATKPKQHPVLQGILYPGNNADILALNQEMYSPNAGTGEYDHDCAYQDGTKVLLLDTDHIIWTEQDTAAWSWKAFLRGAGGFAIMDGGYSTYDDQGGGADFNGTENGRYNLGQIIGYANTVNLVNMIPQNGGTSPCSTGYCLKKTGEYLCLSLSDGSAFTLNLTGDSGTFSLEWYRLSNLTKYSSGTVSGNGNRTLTPPYGEYMVAYLKVQ